jgi:hypothetical protein
MVGQAARMVNEQALTNATNATGKHSELWLVNQQASKLYPSRAHTSTDMVLRFKGHLTGGRRVFPGSTDRC